MAYGPLQKAILQLSKQDNEINEIFIESDPYSHLNDDYFLNTFLPHILAEID